MHGNITQILFIFNHFFCFFPTSITVCQYLKKSKQTKIGKFVPNVILKIAKIKALVLDTLYKELKCQQNCWFREKLELQNKTSGIFSKFLFIQ